jgi:NitT/TauT family transport system substrate-binding protein
VKQIHRTTRAAWLIQCSAAGVATVLGSALPGAAQATVLKIGATPREPTAEGYYALDMGYFKKRGLDVSISVFNSGAAVAAAVVGGDVQIGNSNLLQLSEAYGHGVPFVLVAPAGVYDPRHPDALCVVAAGSPIVSPKDLNGKVVAGASVGGQDQLSISALIDKSGGDSSTVKFIEIPQGEMVAALEAGRIAAAELSEPELSAAGSRVRAIGDPSAAVAPMVLETAWFTTRAWLDRNKDTARRFVAAIYEAGNWSMANPKAAAPILEKSTGFHEAAARQQFARSFDLPSIQALMDAGAKYHMLGKLDARGFIWNGN